MASFTRWIFRNTFLLTKRQAGVSQHLREVCKQLTTISTSTTSFQLTRSLSTSPVLKCLDQAAEDEPFQKKDEEGEEFVENYRGTGRLTVQKKTVEQSIRYMESPAYKRTYGDKPVWHPYRQNFRGRQLPSQPKTRKTCIRGNQICGNPCPICRDEYLVVHRKNVKLLEQFQDPLTGDAYPFRLTRVCQKAQKDLRIAILQAYDNGDMLYKPQPRTYYYPSYYPQLRKKETDLDAWKKQMQERAETRKSQEQEIQQSKYRFEDISVEDVQPKDYTKQKKEKQHV